MKNPIITSILLTCLFAVNLQSQDNLGWRKHVKLADKLRADAQYADAGEHYRAAFKQKTKKTEYAYQAGECFFTIRDYRNAADCWKNVKDNNAAHPLIGLRYARCLKQNGEYEAASSELVNFLGTYQGSDKAAVSQVVQQELRGCELAAQFAAKGDNPDLSVAHLGSSVNTPEAEFAPFPFGDEALYFSSTMGKRAEIYRSLQSGGEWSQATPIENFPAIESDHFCNGTLTPDASRFYFTICKSVENWGGLTTQCEIFVTRKVGKTWTAPEKLPDYLNEAGVSSTHPCVVHDGGTEILYFASNRAGGTGGLDIWYTTRELKSTANDFTLPINAGSRINTAGDDMTPFYDPQDKALYFASNGQVTMGGYDIFKASGAKSQWEKPENLGTPLNSPADDFFFVKTTSGKGGYLVSNRIFGMEKITTTNEDIFSFEHAKPTRQWVAKGEVYDKASRQMLTDVGVELYEITGNGQPRFLSKVISTNGNYDFEVEPSTRYQIQALKDGFFPVTHDFDTRDFASVTDFGVPIYLEPYAQEPAASKENAGGGMKKVTVKENVEVPASPAKKPEDYGSRSKSKTGSQKIATEAPRKEGTYYKIQIIAIGKFDPSQPRYAKVKSLRRLDTEFLPERKLNRVLLADYASLEEAKAELATVRAMQDFSGAFVVEYMDGVRMGEVRQ